MFVRTPAAEQEARKRAERYLAACNEYTDPYEREKLIRDWVEKGSVAEIVVGDFERRAGSVPGKRVLDIGFGGGAFAVAFARKGAEVHGLEVNAELLNIAREEIADAGVSAELRLYDGFTFPYASASFDYCYSSSVLEHVNDPRKIISEIGRILKNGGACYLAFPNRFRPRETHTGVYFLGYLPRDLAQFLMRRIWKRNTIEEINLHFISFFALRRFLRSTGLSIKYEYATGSSFRRLLKRTLAFFGVHHSALLGTIMVVLEKKV